jgi:nicotinamidase-related amidase
MLQLEGRYYRTIPLDRPSYETELLELDPQRTALVVMHCWNIGCECGPAIDLNYWVGIGFPQTTREAGRIMREQIRPAMDASRKAGILVCHVENESIASRHPEAQQDLDATPPAWQDPHFVPPVETGWMQRMVARNHGADYVTGSPYAHMDHAKVVDALPGEPFVHQTNQFHRVLARHGIENLIYTGFATDMCILRAPGGIEPMAHWGYRLFLMRDATIGVECPDTWEERIATRWAIRYFETHFGDTVTSDDFRRACVALC